MGKHLFIINDDGNEYTITNTRIEMDNSFIVDPLLYLETSSEDFYYFVKELVDGDNIVKYPKNLDIANSILSLNNGSIIVTAITSGTSGNDISVTIVDPEIADQTLSVDVSTTNITVYLETDANSIVDSTIQQVVDAINADGSASVLVNSLVKTGGALMASGVSTVNLSGGGGGSDNLEEEDLLITTMDPLEIYKSRSRTKGKHLLKQYCDFTLQFDFFEFSILNNKLINNGYIITDENREAKYLEIINTSNQDLIDILEAYLEVKDKIEIHTHQYDDFQTFKTNVNDSVDISSIDNLFSEFSSSIS